MGGALRFAVVRLLQVIPVVMAIGALNFVLLNMAPGDVG